MEGLAVEVGEVEGFVGAEEAGRGNEGLAVVVLEVGPVTKVGPRDLLLSGFVGVWSAEYRALIERGGALEGGEGEVGEEHMNIQLLTPDKVLVVVDKVIPPLAHRPQI